MLCILFAWIKLWEKKMKILSLALKNKMKRKILKNPNNVELIKELKKLSIEQKVNLWKKIALELEKPSRNKRVVNISKIDRFAKENEIVFVPGKVLSVGELKRPISVCAQSFSEQAEKKILQKGKVFTIAELMKQNPKGVNVRIIG